MKNSKKHNRKHKKKDCTVRRSIAALLAILVLSSFSVMVPTTVRADEGNVDEASFESLDFSSCRLLIKSDSGAVPDFESAETVFDDGDYVLLQFEDEDLAEEAFNECVAESFVAYPDQVFSIAEDKFSEDMETPEETGTETEEISTEGESTAKKENVTETEAVSDAERKETMAVRDNPFIRAMELEKNPKGDAEFDVALIDTGCRDYPNVLKRVSVIDEDAGDGNGHGSMMAMYMTEQNENIRILSVKAMDSDGRGSLSSIIAAVNYAVSRNVKIINLSMSAFTDGRCELFEEVIMSAMSSGAIVVGAAGNNASDVSGYIPGNIPEVIVAGSCNETGDRNPESNYGENVDIYVNSSSTSQAAALLSGFLSFHNLEDIKNELDSGLFFRNKHESEETEWPYLEAVDYQEGVFYISETVSGQAVAQYTVNDATWGMASKRWYFNWYQVDGVESYCVHFGVSYTDTPGAYWYTGSDYSQEANNVAKVKFIVDWIGQSKYDLDEIERRWVIQKYCWESSYHAYSGSNSWYLEYRGGWANMIYDKVVSDALELNIPGNTNIYAGGTGIQEMATIYYDGCFLSVDKEFDERYSPAGAVYAVYDSNGNEYARFIIDDEGHGHPLDEIGTEVYSYESYSDGIYRNILAWTWLSYDFARVIDGVWYGADSETEMALAPGTYTVKEIISPANGNYLLNNEEYSVTVGGDNGDVTLQTRDRLIPELSAMVLPLTGTSDGLVFRIIGLLLATGSLVIILRCMHAAQVSENQW